MQTPSTSTQTHHKAVHLDQCHYYILFSPKANAVCVYERGRERGGIIVLLMDVKGLKLDVIRTTRLYCILYMDTMEQKDGTVGVTGVKVCEILESGQGCFFVFFFSSWLPIKYSTHQLKKVFEHFQFNMLNLTQTHMFLVHCVNIY